MTREEAYTLLTKYIQNKNLLKHCLACEAGMKGIYKRLHTSDFDPQIEEKWGITGLLHDIDYEIAQKEDKLDQHGTLIFEYEKGIPEDIAHGIKAHAWEYTHVMPESDMDWGIACVDQLTGLIVAAALVHPEKMLAPLTTETILKRFKEKAFAKGAKRESIQDCEEHLGIPLPEFIGIVLTSMQGIHEDLGL
jgi:predicted hydrolase (HD superfamily)